MRRLSLLLASSSIFLTIPVLSDPPSTPVIIEPETEGEIVNPADVHMVTGPFGDPDGDSHSCSDWEIWTVTPSERVWVSSCIGGAEKVHIHLGDGVMENSHVDRSELFAETGFRLRVRFRDSSGEMSAWAERHFTTAALSDIQPFEIEDVVESPSPRWLHSLDEDVVLPGGDPAPSLQIEGAADELLLRIAGTDGTRNEITNPGRLPDHVLARVRIAAGDSGGDLVLPESRIVFVDSNRAEQTIYLPAITLAAREQQFFWISAGGSSYFGSADETEPHFGMLARGAPVSWTARQSGYRIETVATGFRLPVSIAFVPVPEEEPDAPFFYVTELYGTIKVVTRDGTVSDYATDLLDFEPTGVFPGSGEQGITGLAIEPETGDLFLSVVYKDDPASELAYARVDRLHSIDGGRTSSSRETVFELGKELMGASHQVAGLSLGPDGKLYVHVGDGGDPATAQNPDSFRGKILRVHLDGSAPSDNPFFDESDGTSARDYVYAYGFRNPFGGAWRAADAHLYEVENGPNVDRMARVVPGRNYLYNESNDSMKNFAIHNWAPAAAPVNIVFVEPGTFGGSGFPTSKQDHAFVSESGPTYASGPQIAGKRISEFILDTDGGLVEGPIPLAEYNGSGKSTAVALARGPDGLYFSDFYVEAGASPTERGSNVLRIQYVGTAATASGLRGEYFDDIELTNRRIVRTDPTVNFDWGMGSPDISIEPDTYSARWSGEVEPTHSEDTTFYTVSDDGVRLWVDDELVIDNWVDQAATEVSGSISLTAGKRVPIVMEYFENGGDAVARLSWESASLEREIIPETRLFSVPIEQQPFTGSPTPIPGLVEAENFDSGGAGVAYSDVDPENQGGAYRDSAVDIQPAADPPPENPDDEEKGFSVGWTKAGEWLEYTVDVELAGLYTISARIGSKGVGGTFHIEFDGVDRTGAINIPDTGDWRAWQTITVGDVELDSGVQVMRIFDDSNGPSGDVGNLNFLEFEHASGRQRPADCDQNGRLNITDGVCLLQYLFAGQPSRLPCGGGRRDDPANIDLLDANRDGGIDLSDAVTVLTYLFLESENDFLGGDCVSVPGCPAVCE